MLFDIEIVAVVAYALLEARIDGALFPLASKNEFFAADIATNRYFYSGRFHSVFLLPNYI
jgi:hypothetical protein